MSMKMSRNILELKSIKIAPEKVQTLAAASVAKLKDFDLKEEYFELVYHPLIWLRTLRIMLRVLTMQMFQPQTSRTLHASYYDNNWLVMMMKLIGIRMTLMLRG